VLGYSVLLVVCSLAPWALGLTGRLYGIAAAVLGAVFLYYAARVWTDRQDASGVSLTKDGPARACFKYSIYYLFVLFGALAADRLIG
jgi:protoheme IX farnesyltransferase